MIPVLIVEDEPVAAEAMATYVDRVPGFVVGGQVGTGAEALRRLATAPFGLVLLDIYLPDMSGLDVVRRMRVRGQTTDVIAVTRARDVEVVQAAVSYGIVHYLVKPFTFAALRKKLESYRNYRMELSAAERTVTQSDIDRLLAMLRNGGFWDLPKGLSRESLRAVVAALRGVDERTGLSAGEVAARVGAARVTVRRYLEYLAQEGLAARRTRYGGAHRPEVEYRWRSLTAHGPSTQPPEGPPQNSANVTT